MTTLADTYTRPSEVIRQEHLSHLIGNGPYSLIHFTDGSHTLFSWPLKSFASKYPHLMRVSKALLVNPDSITVWERISSRYMWVSVAGVNYGVARRRINDVAGQLERRARNETDTQVITEAATV